MEIILSSSPTQAQKFYYFPKKSQSIQTALDHNVSLLLASLLFGMHNLSVSTFVKNRVFCIRLLSKGIGFFSQHLNYLWKNPQLIADSFTYCCQLRCSLHIATRGNQTYLWWEKYLYCCEPKSIYYFHWIPFISYHFTTSPRLTVAHFQHGCFTWPRMVTVEAHPPKKALLFL